MEQNSLRVRSSLHSPFPRGSQQVGTVRTMVHTLYIRQRSLRRLVRIHKTTRTKPPHHGSIHVGLVYTRTPLPTLRPHTASTRQSAAPRLGLHHRPLFVSFSKLTIFQSYEARLLGHPPRSEASPSNFTDPVQIGECISTRHIMALTMLVWSLTCSTPLLD